MNLKLEKHTYKVVTNFVNAVIASLDSCKISQVTILISKRLPATRGSLAGLFFF